MSRIETVGTYLPPWGQQWRREAGPDEDVVTLAVAAGRAALSRHPAGGAGAGVTTVVLVSRDLPLLEGGNSAPLLAGLGLPDDVQVVEQVGGAPAALDAVVAAAPGTLVIGADLVPAGAAAALIGADGAEAELVGRIVRSLPIRSRGADGIGRDYHDPRLESQRGGGVAVERLGLVEPPVVVAGVALKQARALAADPPALPVTGASAALFAIGALTGGGVVLAMEQASATAVRVGSAPVVRRDEPAARAPLTLTQTPGPEIAISLAAYERAFDSKLRWAAGACDGCGTLAFPPRYRCIACGSEDGWSLTALPRAGSVYSVVNVHVPVPGLPTPYSLAIVELDEVGVRALVKVTGAPAGTTSIGDRGTLVLRRVAVRSGVPDYGYALLPDASLSAPDGADTEPAPAGARAPGGNR
ncbi:Zn-ribbon domain-containing OB-fold protein [Tomitella biformata]|uniref:Zn-ribbon domain-containing OB-fold protein n=1 Tax=Tomitella biformata TaxID=630403 RepID=UPI0004658E55|nr:OB-fold domain-containing protein [Tomitella biformata]